MSDSSRAALEALNLFLFIFHTAIVLVNTFGWMFRRTRRLSAITLGLTTASWFVLGAWYGWGYSLCTDWHWQVRRALGYHDHVQTYVQLLLLKLTGVLFPAGPVEDLTLAVYLGSIAGCVWLSVRDCRGAREGV